MSGAGKRGVGLNGEPDDFSARYDRMVVGTGTTGWVVKTLATLLLLLAAVALVSAALS